jgi:hypothetical protein
MDSKDFLDQAAGLVAGPRNACHGPKRENHAKIACLWQAFLETRRERSAPLTPEDAALMLALLKIARTQLGDFNPDDYVDLAGYGSIAGEIAAGEHQVAAKPPAPGTPVGTRAIPNVPAAGPAAFPIKRSPRS